jgi:putative oxidoreductase
MSLWKKITAPTGSNANVLIRFVVGGVFLNEGILKFLYPMWQASGRFAKIGIPYPDFVGPFVGTVETVCGALVILGLLTRPAAFALFIDISVAIFTTKIPVLLGHGFLGFSLIFSDPQYGFLTMVHEARTDFAMWFGLLFLLITGPGRWSADALMTRT